MKTHYKNLRDYVARLEAKGELLRIKSRVSPVLEITEITDRASKSPGGGKAILFENVEGSEFPVLTNAFGSNRRISLALGCDNLDELAERMKNLLDQTPADYSGEAEIHTESCLVVEISSPDTKICISTMSGSSPAGR
jgi:4-hydroxy-3-polyprenylbenzoate decarboxylase